MAGHPSYNEHLLHWIWENRYLTQQPLFTNSEEPVVIHHPGTLNTADGPDFLNARITIGNALTFHGDVEIHWTPSDWMRHGHHTDPNYNRVILHVVFSNTGQTPARRADNTSPPTLVIKPFLTQPLRHFFKKFQQGSSLPCAGNLSFISPEAFTQQIAKAHKEYFEQKVNDLLRHYDPDLPLSGAWQKLLLIALFDGLGITHNRAPMRKLAVLLLEHFPDIKNKQQLIAFALREAGIKPFKKNDIFSWKRKGSRPHNHPVHRISQGCELLWIIKNRPFTEWLRTDVQQSFHWCMQQLEYQPGLGAGRAGTLFGTVWLPAAYILGDLTGSQTRTSAAYDAWLNYRTALPGSITRLFSKTAVAASLYQKKLGTVHQLRAYCRAGRCDECEVFKHVISS